MNCRDVQELLDDLVDGALAEDRRREAARHLEGCAECRTSEAQLRSLLARVGALPRTIAPPHDQWQGVTARIMAGEAFEENLAGRGTRWARLGAAAAAVLIVAVSVVTAVLIGREHGSRVALAPSRAVPATAVVPASIELAQVQATYAAARIQLLAVLEARKGSLSSRTLEVMEQNLRVIDGAVAEMQAAMARDPGNKELPALLVAVYKQQIDLLQSVAQLPARG
jgi:anti-sigma-K factor RskA